jgi:hypothetical protein
MLLGLAGVTGTAVLASCGSTSTLPLASTTTLAKEPTGYGLGARFPDGYNSSTIMAIGSPQRAPYVLLGSDGWPITENVPDSIELIIEHEGATLGPLTINRHGEPGSTPYYPLIFTPPTVGVYTVTLNGSTATHLFKVKEPGDLPMLLVGEQLPPIETPTMVNPQGIEPVCSRFEEPCPFHQLSVTEALKQPRPIAVLVSTPGLCQSDVCGPAVEVLIAAIALQEHDWSVIHAEVYVGPNNNDFTTAPVIDALGLPFEPSLYVANAQGTITEVVHLTMDQREVTAALATAV